MALRAARPASLPYTAREDTCASGPLVPLELPGEEMPGCLGALTLDYYHCNKEPGRHPRYFLLFPPTRSRFRLSCRLHCFAQDMTGCAAMSCDSRQASRQPLPRPTRRLGPPAGQRFAPPPQAILACSRPPQGAPPQPPGHRRTRAAPRDRLGPPALYVAGARYPARPRFA